MHNARKAAGRKARFTLVELLTVMAIIAVLIGIVLGLMGMATRKMAEAKTKSLVQLISVALENYKAKYGYYIQQSTAGAFYLDYVNSSSSAPGEILINNFCQFVDYEALHNKDCQLSGSTLSASNKYWVVDGFGSPLVYRCPGFYNRSGFDLGSGGADGYYGSPSSGAKSVLTFDNTAYTTVFGQGDDITNFTRK